MTELEFGAVDLEETAKKLSSASMDPNEGLHEPFTRVTYQELLDRNRFQFPEHLLSLFHHPVYSELTYEQKWELSLQETINFFSINIHGERKLVQGLEERLYVPSRLGGTWAIGDYIQHFIHEENAHTHMLAGYCYRYGDGVMKDYSIQVADPTLSSIGQDLLFFGRVFVLESFLDYLNSNAMRDDSLDTTARQIHRFHHVEEARHMAFDRAVIRYCINEMKNLGLQDEFQVIAKLLGDFGKVAQKSLYSPKVYKKVGIQDVTSIAREAQKIQARVELEHAWMSKSRDFLGEVGLTISSESLN